MARYVAFLRGVMPTNAKMPALRKAFESAGFANVATVLGSGNVVFTARAATESALERKAEAAMAETMGRAFYTIVRPLAVLQQLIDADPYAAFRVAPNAKRVVTFSRTEHRGGLTLPIDVNGARILAVVGREVFTAYVPGASTPVFMTLIEKHFGANVTTRTWDTVGRCVKAAWQRP